MYIHHKRKNWLMWSFKFYARARFLISACVQVKRACAIFASRRVISRTSILFRVSRVYGSLKVIPACKKVQEISDNRCNTLTRVHALPFLRFTIFDFPLELRGLRYGDLWSAYAHKSNAHPPYLRQVRAASRCKKSNFDIVPRFSCVTRWKWFSSVYTKKRTYRTSIEKSSQRSDLGVHSAFPAFYDIRLSFGSNIEMQRGNDEITIGK